MNNIRFGISPLTWTNDDMPNLGGNIPLTTCLEEMAAAGFEGTELGTKYPRTAQDLSPLLGGNGLVLASGWYSGRLMVNSVDEEIEAAQSHMNLLKSLGSTVMVMGEVSNSVHGDIETPLSNRVILTPEEWSTYGQKMTAFSDYMQDNGIRVAYHNHVGTIVETMPDLKKFLDTTGPSVGITIDTGHITYAGGDPCEAISMLSNRIVHVHAKDVRCEVMEQAIKEDWSFLNAVLAGVFTVPGDGCIDFEAVLRELHKSRYCGWVVVEAEQDPEKHDPFTYANMAYKNLNEYAANVGY